MRKFMEAAIAGGGRGGVVNVHNPLVFTYRTKNGETVTHTEPSMKQALENLMTEFDINNPAVQQWLRSNFLNFCARGDFSHPAVRPLFRYAKNTMAGFIGDDLADIIYGVDENSENYPDISLYGVTMDDTRFVDALIAQLPDWMRDGYVIGSYSLWPWHEEWLGGLIDYLNAMAEQGVSLTRLSVPDAIRKSAAWHTQRFHVDGKDVEGQDIRTVMEFPDGWRIVQLLTSKALDRESYLCSHCVGKGGYDKAVADGSRRIFSLRDADNTPHATLSVLPDDSVVEAKGRENLAVASTLHAHIHQFILSSGFSLKADHDKIGLRRLNAPKRG